LIAYHLFASFHALLLCQPAASHQKPKASKQASSKQATAS
jgi:hypothetical protein